MKLEDFELEMRVFAIHEDSIQSFVVVRIVKQEAVYPFGLKRNELFPVGLVLPDEYTSEIEVVRHNLSRSNNPPPNVIQIEVQKIFKTKEDLIKSL